MMWNLGYLFFGLGFAGWVFAQVPRLTDIQRAPMGEVPRLPSVDKIRMHRLERVASVCLRECFIFFRDTLRSDRHHLRKSILSLPALNVAGTGLESALKDILPCENCGDDGASASADSEGEMELGREDFEGALRAAILCARQLSCAGLLSLDLPRGVSADDFSSSGWEQRGAGPAGPESSEWGMVHSVLVVCLVAKACGAEEEEILQYVVQPLQFEEGGEIVTESLRLVLKSLPQQPPGSGDDFDTVDNEMRAVGDGGIRV